MRDLYNYKAVCTKVVDGDTADFIIDVGFKLTTMQRIRFLGIDTPERGQTGYLEAKEYLTNKILNKDLVLQTYKSDDFGRYLADVYLNGEHINEEMIYVGLAVFYE